MYVCIQLYGSPWRIVELDTTGINILTRYLDSTSNRIASNITIQMENQAEVPDVIGILVKSRTYNHVLHTYACSS